MSQIWKEIAFKDRELDVNYMQYWVAVFQVIVGFAIAPLNALPFLGSQRVSLNNMVSMMTGGSACLFLGKNSIVEVRNSLHVPNKRHRMSNPCPKESPLLVGMIIRLCIS